MLKVVLKAFKWLVIALCSITVLIALFVNFSPVFGGKPDVISLEKISRSPHFQNKMFRNLVETVVSTESQEELSLMDFIKPPPGKNPASPLPSIRFDQENFDNGDFVWLGHSTVLMRINDLTIITDPIFSNAAPLPFVVEPFEFQHKAELEDLPNIDIVLISHDHYDHLDYSTIRKLDAKVKFYLVPLGVKAHLQRWGVKDDKVIEMDWYEQHQHGVIKFNFLPSRHFSGRGLNDRFSTLWGSWAIHSESQRVFFSGDTGYFDEFKKIGLKYGPFDIAFLEDGAYNEAWNQIHMFPEQSIQASVDLNAKLYVPIHWGKFDLSVHPWTEPVERAKLEGEKRGVNVVTPLVGRVFNTQSAPQTRWWDSVR